MRLYFMRHGQAEDTAPSDAARALTDKGREDVQAVARVLAALKNQPDRIYASPRLRAQQTAQIMADALGQTVTTRDEVNFDFSIELLRPMIADVQANVLFVGHNPSMSSVLHHVSGANISLTTASVGCVEYLPTMPMGQLVWLLTPRVCRALA